MRTPPAAGWLARRARELAEPAAARRAVATAVPPRRLRARTGAPGIREFVEGGRRAAQELAAALPGTIDGYAGILDFGCGSGRVLPHVAEMASEASCTGCDVDADAIAWASAHLPDLSFAVSRSDPPLPFETGAFDLVYSISVLSHLDEPGQDRWLSELVRVVAPGGHALLSIHGDSAFERFRRSEVRTAWCDPEAFNREPLAPQEFAFVPYRRSIWNRGDLPGVAASYGLAFHGERYVRERWERWFEVQSILPRALTDWQDLVLLRRRSGG